MASVVFRACRVLAYTRNTAIYQLLTLLVILRLIVKKMMIKPHCGHWNAPRRFSFFNPRFFDRSTIRSNRWTAWTSTSESTETPARFIPRGYSIASRHRPIPFWSRRSTVLRPSGPTFLPASQTPVSSFRKFGLAPNHNFNTFRNYQLSNLFMAVPSRPAWLWCPLIWFQEN